MEIQKILIIRLSSIGDIILATPLIRSVRLAFPGAQLDFVVKDQFKELVQTNPHLSQVLVFKKNSERNSLRILRNIIRKEKYDWIIDIHRNFRSLYLRTGSGAGLITSYHKGILKRSLLVYLGLNLYRKVDPVMLRYFEATDIKGIGYDNQGTEVVIPAATKTLMIERFPSLGSAGRIITLCPGASFANKRWPTERFQEIGRNYSSTAQVILVGGEADSEVCHQLAGQIPGALTMAGQLSLLESAFVLSRSSMVITNDSGMMHLAQSQKVPVVAIFGPTTQELGYFPMPGLAAVVEADVSCRPCTHNGLDQCPKGHFRCMKDIPAQRVMKTSAELLSTVAHSVSR